MVEYYCYFILWGLDICATYYIKVVQGFMLYVTLILTYGMEEALYSSMLWKVLCLKPFMVVISRD